jgi:hypothetical protein
VHPHKDYRKTEREALARALENPTLTLCAHHRRMHADRKNSGWKDDFLAVLSLLRPMWSLLLVLVALATGLLLLTLW